MDGGVTGWLGGMASSGSRQQEAEVGEAQTWQEAAERSQYEECSHHETPWERHTGSQLADGQTSEAHFLSTEEQ